MACKVNNAQFRWLSRSVWHEVSGTYQAAVERVLHGDAGVGVLIGAGVGGRGVHGAEAAGAEAGVGEGGQAGGVTVG